MIQKRDGVISGLSGGLGNQMFQYAAARSLSLRLDLPLQLDTAWYANRSERRFDLAHFRLKASVLKRWDRMPAPVRAFESRVSRRLRNERGGLPIIREPHFHYSDILASSQRGGYLEGYWQSYRYFEDNSGQIRSEFSLRQPMSNSRQAVAETMATQNAVSMHVRRGDYVHDPIAHSTHGTCSPAWYEQVIAMAAAEISRAHFYVFSDDIEWTAKNLPPGYAYTFVGPGTDQRDFEDIHLMSQCQHHIVANSSFSWWAAWLNPSPNKRVFAPRKWFASASKDPRDLIPSAWVQV